MINNFARLLRNAVPDKDFEQYSKYISKCEK